MASTWETLLNAAVKWAPTVTSIGSGLYGLSKANQVSNMGQSAYDISAQYDAQLADLLANPDKIKDVPGYEFGFEQGSEAVSRKMAASGFLGSGNAAIALQKFGTDYATKQFNDYANLLAQLAGRNYGTGIEGVKSGTDIAGDSLASLGYGVQQLAGLYSGGKTVADTLIGSLGGVSTAGSTAAGLDSLAGSAASGAFADPAVSALVDASLGLGGGAATGVGAFSAAGGAAASGAALPYSWAAGAESFGAAAGTSLSGLAAGGTVAAETLAPITSLAAAPGYTGAAAASAGGGAGSAVLAAAPYLIGALAIAAIIGNQGHDKNVIGNLVADQKKVQLPNSDYQGVQQGNMVLGAGGDRKKGSGQFYIVDAEGIPRWAGQDGSTLLSYYTRDFAKWTPEDVATYSQAMASGDHSQLTSSMQAALTDMNSGKKANLIPRLQTYYDQLGGQAALGTDFAGWLTQVGQLGISVTGETWGA